MRATSLKTLRDLHRQRGQVIAVAVTIMLGVLLYVSSAGAFQNLSSSYHYTYDSMNFADLVGTGGCRSKGPNSSAESLGSRRTPGQPSATCE